MKGIDLSGSVTRRLASRIMNVLKNGKVYNSVVRRFACRVDWRATEPLDWSFFKSCPVFCRLANWKTIDGFYHVEYVPLIDRWPHISFEKLWKPSTAFIAYVSKMSRQRGLDHAHSNRALERTLCTVDQALVISLCACFYPSGIIQSSLFGWYLEGGSVRPPKSDYLSVTSALWFQSFK